MYFLRLGTYTATLDKIALGFGMSVAFLFGGWTHLLTALLVLHLLDIITGLLVGGMNHNISSTRMHVGIKKKLGGWIALILANVIDVVLFDKQPIAITGLAFVLISNEGLSIIENLGILGVPIPDVVTGYLEQIQNQGDKAEFDIGKPPVPAVEKVVVENEEGAVQELYSERYLEEEREE